MDLLHTKLRPPPLRAERVTRLHLLHRLDAALSHALTLLSAPAGYGKTTLLSQWVDRRPAPTGWLSFDRSDNDPAQFLRYLLAALQHIDPAAGALLPGMLQPPKPSPIPKILVALINDLAASHKEFVIILDDYQEIDAQAVHDLLAQLIEHMPPNLHMILAARADPPLNLPQLRARGQLLELRAADLCFDSASARIFFQDAMALPLSGEDIHALLRKAEGWIAGLQIAAIYLQNQPDLSQAVQAFTGSHRHILDYLAVEVIERLPESVQEFLSHTAILDDLQASLCDAVTGRSDGQHILESLDRANQFIIPLDEERCWYRYHRLMAEALRRRTENLERSHLADLHRRASGWYAAQGMTSSAIRHSFAAGDLQRAAGLIEASAEAMLKSSLIVTLLEWLDRLPEELVYARPALNMAYAWALLFKGGSIRAVQARLEASQAAGSPASAPEAVIRAMIATLTGDLHQGLLYSQRALQELPPGSAFLRSIAADNLGIAYVIQGDVQSAIQAFKQSSALAQESGNTMFVVASLSNLGGLYLVQGHLQLAAEVYRQALAGAASPTGQRLPVACRALMGLGEITREWNHLEQARMLLEQALQLSQQYSETGELVICLNLARVLQSQRDEKGALELLYRAQVIARHSTASPIDDRLVDAALARTWLQQGNLAGASGWAASRGFEQVAPGAALPDDHALTLPYDLHEAEWMVYARLQLAQNRAQPALLTLTALLTTAQQQGRIRRQHEILLLLALAHRQAGSAGLALESLESSLVLAQSEGHMRSYIEEGAPMAELLREAVRRGIQKEYCSRLLSALRQEPPAPHRPSGIGIAGLPDPLSTEPSQKREPDRATPKRKAVLREPLSTGSPPERDPDRLDRTGKAALVEPLSTGSPPERGLDRLDRTDKAVLVEPLSTGSPPERDPNRLNRGGNAVLVEPLGTVSPPERELDRFDRTGKAVLVEPLSERELQVLHLLAEGCTNREISQRLYISLSTVKGHVANISGKLLAGNRTEAVARARQLGLLPAN